MECEDRRRIPARTRPISGSCLYRSRRAIPDQLTDGEILLAGCTGNSIPIAGRGPASAAHERRVEMMKSALLLSVSLLASSVGALAQDNTYRMASETTLSPRASRDGSATVLNVDPVWPLLGPNGRPMPGRKERSTE
jgi:hypothetical protein